MARTAYLIGLQESPESPISGGLPDDMVVKHFPDSERARVALSSRPPDLVLADGGRDDVRQLLADAQGDEPDTPTVIITMGADSSVTQRCVEIVGSLFHLAAPYTERALRDRVSVLLERRSLADSLKAARDALSQRDRALSASRKRVDEASHKLQMRHTELEVATERLVTSEQLAAVGRVVGGLAHEIGKQLALVGYAEAIKARVVGDDELTELADVIVVAQRRLSSMVDEIRDFANANDDTLEREPGELGTAIADAVAIMRYDRDFGSRNVRREFRQRPIVSLNRNKIEQVIINLLTNATQATEVGDSISIVLDQEDGFATVTVQDDGVGMSEEVRRRLGEIFFTTRGERGSGLGVGICSRIIAEHGGSLTFESAPGQGTRALIRLPLYEEERQ